MKDYKFICKSDDKNVKDKKYAVLTYAKQYALAHQADIVDYVTGKIIYTYNDLKKEVEEAAKETLGEVKDLHEEVKNDAKDEFDKDCDELKKTLQEDVKYVSDKADKGLYYTEKKTNKLFAILRKFINNIKLIFSK